MKKIVCVCVCLFSIFLLTACSTTAERKDTVTVYDSEDKELYIISNQEDLDFFANLVSESTKNIQENVVISDIPDDMQISYHYVCSANKGNNEKLDVHLYVYENYPYITLTGYTVKTPIAWQLSDDECTKLQNPDNWFNQ